MLAHCAGILSRFWASAYLAAKSGTPSVPYISRFRWHFCASAPRTAKSETFSVAHIFLLRCHFCVSAPRTSKSGTSSVAHISLLRWRFCASAPRAAKSCIIPARLRGPHRCQFRSHFSASEPGSNRAKFQGRADVCSERGISSHTVSK